MPTKEEIADEIAGVTGGDRPDPDNMTKAELEAMLLKVSAGNDEPEREPATKDEGEPGKEGGPEGEAVEGEAENPLEDLRAPGGVTRRKVNRGSTRRINRALESVTKALEEFATEIDRQVYITDEKGDRVGTHELVTDVRGVAKNIAAAVATFTTP